MRALAWGALTGSPMMSRPQNKCGTKTLWTVTVSGTDSMMQDKDKDFPWHTEHKITPVVWAIIESRVTDGAHREFM